MAKPLKEYVRMRSIGSGLAIAGLLTLHASTTLAQWTRVEAIPPTDVASVHITGNTILAGTDSAVYISTNGGADWVRSATLPNSPTFIDAAILFDGKIFAGTGGNGVYMSSNGGQS
jgi:photosystem II stability/assembly factor-like uncharacterized protein